MIYMYECSICMETIKLCTKLNCGHTFCTKCIYYWATSCNNTCPLCRISIDVPLVYKTRSLPLRKYPSVYVVAFPTIPEIGMTLMYDFNFSKIIINTCVYKEYIGFELLAIDGVCEFDALECFHDIVNEVSDNSRLCEIVMHYPLDC